MKCELSFKADPNNVNGAASYTYDNVDWRQKTSTMPGYPGGRTNYNGSTSANHEVSHIFVYGRAHSASSRGHKIYRIAPRRKIPLSIFPAAELEQANV